MEKKNAIVLFDGYCRLCNGVIQFLLKKDINNVFYFAPLQSEIGKKILNGINIKDKNTVVFIYANSFYTHSDAFIEMIRFLPSPWNWLRILKLIPKNFRNLLYYKIAANRLKWFGKQNSCSIHCIEATF